MKKIVSLFTLLVGMQVVAWAQPNQISKFTGIFELEENMSFLRTVSGIMSSLEDIHSISKTDEASKMDVMLKRSSVRRLMQNGVECTIPFDFAGSTVSDAEKQYLNSFIQTLDSVGKSYTTRFKENLTFQIAVLGYTDRSGTDKKNQVLAESRAQNAARILKRQAVDAGMQLIVTQIEGRPNENPVSEQPCEESDPDCRICKIILTRIIP